MFYTYMDNNKDVKRVLSQGDKNQLIDSAKHLCECCGKGKRKLTSGHIKAHSKGGKTSLKNSVALCMDCNSNMRSKDYRIYMKEMGWKIPKTVTLRTGIELKTTTKKKPTTIKKTTTKKKPTTVKKTITKKKPKKKKNDGGLFGFGMGLLDDL